MSFDASKHKVGTKWKRLPWSDTHVEVLAVDKYVFVRWQNGENSLWTTGDVFWDEAVPYLDPNAPVEVAPPGYASPAIIRGRQVPMQTGPLYSSLEEARELEGNDLCSWPSMQLTNGVESPLWIKLPGGK